MRWLLLSAFFLTAVMGVSGQTATGTTQSLPDDPQKLLAAAEPFYNFNSPELKPWHLKATYQLYDDKGKPTEQGTYEYWWASPQVYRSTWTRAGTSRSIWHTADGKIAATQAGERLKYFEKDLPNALFSPLPNASGLDPAKIELDSRILKLGQTKFPCVMLVPKAVEANASGPARIGEYSTYCFSQQIAALRVTYRFGQVTTVFDRTAKMQNRFLPLTLQVLDGERKLFSANVETVNGMSSSDSVLVPAKDAQILDTEKQRLDEKVTQGSLVKKLMPSYPLAAKNDREQGTVVLDATIGTDGKVHDPEVVVSPWPYLTSAAIDAVSQWRYKPYVVDGNPVEVETTITVIFALGR